MLSVVTGAAGFIGSHLCEALLARGDTVRGVDCFTDYYDPSIKRRNLADVLGHERFTLHELDLRDGELGPILEGADVVFHEAAQPGVRLSWADGFRLYDAHNITATHRLLEACRAASTSRIIFASSSSVYGNAASYPCDETDSPDPFSPYGVTKLAGEHLFRAYASNFGVTGTILRYFTVYGPRQRPDMAFNRLIAAGLGGDPFPLYGDGSAIRDFTFVDDVVRANLAASTSDTEAGEIINVAGGGSAKLSDLIALAGELIGEPIPIDQRAAVPGDVARTGGSIEKASRLLGWKPEIAVSEGLAKQIAWQRAQLATGA
jgi:nucleoside-diphosphate-sugar epimerase